MNKELEQCACQCSGGQKPLTITECIDSLETLFKAYQKDSEFNYQLSVSDSPFNTLKQYTKAFEIIIEKEVDMGLFNYCNAVEQYNKNLLKDYEYDREAIEPFLLTQEEFDLLKETL